MDNFSKDLKFAFSDFLALLKRHKRTVAAAILLGAALCLLLAVTRPVNYMLQSSFRDKGKSKANIHSSLTDLLISPSSSQDSETISVMKSHFLLSKIIKEIHIQGKISKIQPSHPDLENAMENVLVEWAYWNSWQVPILDDPKDALSLENIVYNGELKRVFILEFQSPDHFTVKSEEGSELGNGKLNAPFQYQDSQFTVINPQETAIAPEELYMVVIEPMANMVNLLIKDLVINVDKDDKSLLRLQFKNRNRHFAKKVLNTLMDTYQKHLEDDHELFSTIQVNYLEQRQKEAGKSLETLMENYVKNVSDDMSQSGFTSLQREMDFLAANLASNQQKLTEIGLETKRLKNINCDDCVHYDSYTGRGDPAIINHLLAEIRALKQQSDSLELALQNKRSLNPKEASALLESNFKDMENTKACLKETENLVDCLQNNTQEPQELAALDNAGYSVGAWLKAYTAKETLWQTASGKEKKQFRDDLTLFKNHFLSYLDTFKRLLKIQESTLEQRMRTQKAPGIEFEGITLDTSRNLYMGFVQELNTLEASEKQHRFVVDQLINPDFELSSLTALLQDPISQQRIAKASEIVINLKDAGNRTQKELERLTEELQLQKLFLNAHILQMADLLKLKIELIQEKITSIQNTTLDLTHQKISLLKKHLADYIETRLENFVQEKKLLEEDQIALHQRMASIPPKWASEQLLNQSLALQQRFLENLANMVESKNITKNLEMIQSSPLDQAIPPLHPKPPRLLFFTIFGSILGLIGASVFLFTRTMIRGIPASLDNLRLANFHVSGKISPFQGDEISASTPFLDTDLDTLRRLIARYEKDEPGGLAKLILIAPGNGPDFSNTLAKLLAKKGQTTLKLQLGFNKPNEGEMLPGLLQYLEGKANAPTVEELDGFDRIAAGGVSRYSEELLRSPRFAALLDKLKPSYDWILGVSPMKIPSAEAENLAKLFDGAVVVVTNETLQNLIAFNDTLDQNKKDALTFVMADKTHVGSRSSGG